MQTALLSFICIQNKQMQTNIVSWPNFSENYTVIIKFFKNTLKTQTHNLNICIRNNYNVPIYVLNNVELPRTKKSFLSLVLGSNRTVLFLMIKLSQSLKMKKVF